MAPARPDLMRVLPDDANYRRQAEAEARFWAGPHPFGIEAPWDKLPEARRTSTVIYQAF